MTLTLKNPNPVSEACATCEAHRVGLCDLLDDASATLISSRCQRLRYGTGDEIALQGEKSERIGIVVTGLVKIVLLTEEGEHHLLQILKPGQIVGDPCKADNAFSWEAATETEICWINRQTLEAIKRNHPTVHQAYLEITARQLEEHRIWTASMRGRSTTQRIAFWLLQQVPDPRDTAQATIRITLTRRDLASLLDMTVETLCRGLRQLSDRGAIQALTPDKIEVLNIAKLRLFARCKDSHLCNILNCRDHALAKDNPFCISAPLPRDRGWHMAAKSYRRGDALSGLTNIDAARRDP